LHVAESVSLGEKRFVAVVQFESQRFLIGGTGTSLRLLAELKSDEGTNSERSEGK
jgi:flagellar biogenesis protein FliO